MRIIIKILSIIAMFVAISCQEVFEPEDLDVSKRYIAISGLITDKPGPYYVNVTWSSGFHQQTVVSNNKAKVFIIDDAGKKVGLKLSKIDGQYFSEPSELQGEIGKSYKVRVEVASRFYESKFMRMQPKVSIDSIYARVSKNKVIEKNGEGEVIVHVQNGISFYQNASSTSNEPFYARFENKILAENELYFEIERTIYTKYYWRVIRLTNLPQLAYSSMQNNTQMIGDYYSGFFPYIPGEISTYPEDGSEHSVGWIWSTILYSIPAETHKYYSLIYSQLQERNSIFDPIPSQIQGNIRDIVDSSAIVLGYFEVASVSRKNKLFLYRLNNSETVWKAIDDDYAFPSVTRGVDTTNKPKFWIPFY